MFEFICFSIPTIQSSAKSTYPNNTLCIFHYAGNLVAAHRIGIVWIVAD
jgi:hypothetical protein